MACNHDSLTCESSQYSATVGYPRRTQRQLKNAAGKGLRDDIDVWADIASPLILPDDDLACDPKYPPQSVKAWKTGKSRNAVVPERQTIYVAASPEITPTMARMAAWNVPSMRPASDLNDHVATPGVDQVVQYLEAFYYGLPVKVLPPSEYPLSFVEWEESRRSRQKPDENPQVALATASEAIRIRARPCPDATFPYQLNLNDILDVVIDVLPHDAYCLLLLVDQDLYEDEDDDFCCGRAYGGSRCAVVSTARYNPFLYRALLDAADLHHPWPLSHCVAYVENIGGTEDTRPTQGQGTASSKSQKTKKATKAVIDGPAPSESALNTSEQATSQALERAFDAFTSGPQGSDGADQLFGVCRTASHEIGHCFGMDHCVYFACIMQGTASVGEDRRQPPDLCPIDLEKLRQALNEHIEDVDWEEERYQALAKVCRGHVGASWSAFEAWLQARLERIKLM